MFWKSIGPFSKIQVSMQINVTSNVTSCWQMAKDLKNVHYKKIFAPEIIAQQAHNI